MSIDILRRLVRQQTTSIGQPVTNLWGAAAPVSTEIQKLTASEVLLIDIPGQAIGNLSAVYDYLLSNPAAATSTVRQIYDNTLVFSSADQAAHTFLVRAGLQVSGQALLNITVEFGSTRDDMILYVDGTMQRTVREGTTIGVMLDAGAHVVELLYRATSAGVMFSQGVLLTAANVLTPPVWISGSSSYLGSGVLANRLAWNTQFSASGWNIYRGVPQDIYVSTAISAVNSDRRFAITMSGDRIANLRVGDYVIIGGDLVGTISSYSYDGTNSIAVVLLEPSYTDISSSWAGLTVSTVRLAELAYVARTIGNVDMAWDDVAIQPGIGYLYAARAVDLFNTTRVSALSRLLYVYAQDTSAPAAISFVGGYPKVINKRIIVLYNTPSDADYQGTVFRYRNNAATGTSTGTNSTTTLNDTGKSWTPSAFIGYEIILTGGTGSGQIRPISANTGTQVTVSVPWDTTPDATTTYIVYNPQRLLTDYGKPSVQDQLSLDAGSYGIYDFRAIDFGGNESTPVTFDYDASDDTYIAANQPPVLGIEQLTDTEISSLGGLGLSGDTLNNAVIRLSASDVEDPTSAVKIEYQTRTSSGWVTGSPYLYANSAADGFDTPGGTRKRLIRLQRGNENNWLQARAKDSAGLYSDTMTYTADWDVIPEVSAVETSLEPISGNATLRILVDDDTQSFRWRYNSGSWTTVTPTSIVKLQTVTMATTYGTGYRIEVEPYSGTALGGVAGSIYTTELLRPPKTVVVVEELNADGERTVATAQIKFNTQPTISSVYSSTVSSSTASTLVVGGTPWTAGAYTPVAETYKVYYVRTVSATTGVIQTRRIASNTNNTLTIATNWDTNPVTSDTFAIYPGAVRYQLDAGGWKTIFPGDALSYARDNSVHTLQFQCELNSVPREELQSITIDADRLPSITSLAIQDSAANEITISVNGYDDDLKSWKCYVRKTATNEFPTLDGTSTGAPDSLYKKFEGSDQELSFKMYTASTTKYNVVAVPYNAYGEVGPAVTGTITTSATILGALTNIGVVASDNGGTAYNKLFWDHNTPTSGTWTVDVSAYREDLGPGTATSVVTARDWAKDAGTGANAWLNSDDTDTISNKGSLLHGALPLARGSDVNYTWVYLIDLKQTGTLKSSYIAYHTGGYALPAPSFSGGVTVTEQDQGTCELHWKGYAYGNPPFTWRSSWTVSNPNDSAYRLDVYHTTTQQATLGSTTYASGPPGLVKVTLNGHGLSTGNSVYINGCSDSNVNGWWTITYVDANNFTLQSSSTSASTSGSGTLRKTFLNMSPLSTYASNYDHQPWSNKIADAGGTTQYFSSMVTIVRLSDSVVTGRIVSTQTSKALSTSACTPP